MHYRPTVPSSWSSLKDGRHHAFSFTPFPSGSCATAEMEKALPRFTILPRVEPHRCVTEYLLNFGHICIIFKLNNGNNCGIQGLDLGVAPGFTFYAFRHLDTQDYC